MSQMHVDGLTFTFAQGSHVSKYDEWSFYRKQFNGVCGGAKAVDIVYVDSQNSAWLIEVKDYRIQQRTKPQDLGDEIAEKVRDTLAGLVAASIYANDPNEQSLAKKAVSARKLNVVFHLEQRITPSKLFGRPISEANLVIKLKQKLKAIDAHPKVVAMNSMHTSMNWSVF